MPSLYGALLHLLCFVLSLLFSVFHLRGRQALIAMLPCPQSPASLHALAWSAWCNGMYLVTVEEVFKRETLRSCNDHVLFVKENKMKYV